MPHRAPDARLCAMGWEQRLARLRLFFDPAHLAAAIVAAIRTDEMRRLQLAALRARSEGNGLEGVVCAALGRACLGVSAFWIWHGSAIG